MGQAVAKETFSELKDVTLKGVVPLNKELGRGSYGIVFTVKHKGIVCAAKKIHPILTETVSPEQKQGIKDYFIKECLFCSNIRHPNIVKFLGVYYEPGPSNLPIIVMELMDTSLAKFVECNKSKISFETKVSILLDVSLGLSFLHSHNPPILHRDLSSNNVMLTKQSVAKIGDLGVAKVARADNRQTKSKLTTSPGTLHFMPPEAQVDNPAYGTTIDVFSFGGITLHVFSEEWPTPSAFRQKDPYTKKMVTLTEVERRQQYLDKMTGKAAGFRKTTEKCLDDDPDERPAIQEVSTIIESLKKLPSLTRTPQSKNTPKSEKKPQSEKGNLKWKRCPDVPYKMKSASVATNAAKNKVYVIPKNNKSKDGGKSCFCYDFTSKQWEQLPEMKHYYCALLLCNGNLNAIGGKDSKSNNYSPKVSTFLEDTNTWASIYPDMLKPRLKPGVAAYQNQMVVAGGCVQENLSTDDIEILNCEQKPFIWKRCAVQLPIEMWAINLAVYEDHIYIVGFSEMKSTSGKAYRISTGDLISSPYPTKSYTAENRWDDLPGAPYIRAGVVSISSHLLSVGGSMSSKVKSDIFSFDKYNLTWRKIGLLTSARADVAVCALSDTTIMAIGGYSRDGSLQASEESSMMTVEVGEIKPVTTDKEHEYEITSQTMQEHEYEITSQTMEEHHYELTSQIMKDNENDSASDNEIQENYALSVHVQSVNDDHELSSSPPLSSHFHYKNTHRKADKSPPPLPPRPGYEVQSQKSGSFSAGDQNQPALPARNDQKSYPVRKTSSLITFDEDSLPPAITPRDYIKDLQKTCSVRRCNSLELCKDDASPPAIPPKNLPSLTTTPQSKRAPQSEKKPQSEKGDMKWKRCPDVPYKMKSASVATNAAKNKVFIIPKNNKAKDGGKSCFCYDFTSTQWEQLPEMEHYYCALLLCNGNLNAIGGKDSKSNNYSPKVSTFLEDTNTWVSIYPDMLKPRLKPGVAAYQNQMVVAGGYVRQNLSTDDIEILNCEKKPFLWKRCAIQLPIEMWAINLAVCKDYIYIVGFSEMNSTSGKSYRIPAGDLIPSPHPSKSYTAENQWDHLPGAPYIRAGVVSIGSHLVIVGGSMSSKVQSDIFSFDRYNLTWRKIGVLTSARADVAVCALSDTTIMVIGGYSRGGGLQASEESSMMNVEMGEIKLVTTVKGNEYEITSQTMKDNENDNDSDNEIQENYALSVHVQSVNDDHELSSSPPLPSRPCYENVNKIKSISPPPLPPRSTSSCNVQSQKSGSFSAGDQNPIALPPRNDQKLYPVRKTSSLITFDEDSQPPAITPRDIQDVQKTCSVKRCNSLELCKDDPKPPAIPPKILHGIHAAKKRVSSTDDYDVPPPPIPSHNPPPISSYTPPAVPRKPAVPQKPTVR